MKRLLLSLFLIIFLAFLVVDFVAVPALADSAKCESEGCECSCRGTGCRCDAGGGTCSCECETGPEVSCEPE